MTMPERLQMSGNIAFVGVSVVFIILTSLILIISIFPWIFNRPAKNKGLKSIDPTDEDYKVAEEDELETAYAAQANQVMNDLDPDFAVMGDLDPELIAVIAAAITVSMEEGVSFRLRSIRRTGTNTPAWNRSGRNAYLSTRL